MSCKYRSFILSSVIVVAGLWACSSSPSQPNVILFLIDDFGYGDISYEGNRKILTPNIDRIARGGARFSRFYQSSAACAPTRAALLTGRYHLMTGVWDVHDGRDFLRRDETTLADVFRQAGYATGAFGKWHSGKTNAYFSWNRGFDLGIHPKLYTYLNTTYIFNNKLVKASGPAEDLLGEEAVKFINGNKKKPFFAYIPIQSIHEPYNCPEELFTKYKNLGHSDHVSRLYGMIELLDRNIGKILDAVEENHLSERTLIMFLSDDGPSPGFDLSYQGRRMNDEEKEERSGAWSRILRGGKASIYEGGSITPFYIMWKDHIQPSLHFNQITGIIDIFPTLLEACQIKIAEDNLPLSGQSLWPLLQGKEISNWDDRFYFDNTNFYLIPKGKIDTSRPRVREISVNHQHYKLIRFDRYYQGRDTVFYELYNLKEDPFETKNLSATETEITRELSSKIDVWFNSIINDGRAFGQAIFEIGNRDEVATPLNLDAYEELNLPENPDRTSFSILGWTKSGSLIRYKIDVIREGDYQIELGYDPIPDNSGAKFSVYTEHDTSLISIDPPLRSTLSGIMHLPPGPQLLTLELVDPGGKEEAVERIRQLVIHYLPEAGEMIQAGFILKSGTEEFGPFYPGHATTEFMFSTAFTNPVVLPKNSVLEIVPFCENPSNLDRTIIYRNFTRIAEKSGSPDLTSLTNSDTGTFTINVEFMDVHGGQSSARAEIEIR